MAGGKLVAHIDFFCLPSSGSDSQLRTTHSIPFRSAYVWLPFIIIHVLSFLSPPFSLLLREGLFLPLFFLSGSKAITTIHSDLLSDGIFFSLSGVGNNLI